jgi:HD-GYP domain-containing protein (c-di-GMP phosphodiesterase class II)
VFDFVKRQPSDARDPKVVLLERLNAAQEALGTQPVEAFVQANALLEEAVRLGDGALLGRVHLIAGRGALQSGDLEVAQTHLERAAAACDVGTRSALEAGLYLGRVLRDRGDTTRAIETLSATVHDAQAWGHVDLAADAMNSLSSLQYAQGAYGAALSTLNDAATLARRLRQPAQEAKFLNNAAQILTQLGDHEGALQHLLEAQAKLRDVPEDGRNEIAYLLNVGSLHARMGDQDKARECFAEALTLAEERGDAKAATAARNNLANALLERGDHAAAETMFIAALEAARGSGHVSFEVDNLDGLGEVYRARGWHDRALAIHREALRLSRANDDPEGVMDALVNLGRDHVALNDPVSALEALHEALELALEAQRQQTVFEAHEWLAKVYESRGDLVQALEHFQRFHEVRKNVFHEAGERQRTMLHAQFALERSRLERRLAQQAWHDTQQQISLRTAELELTQAELVSALATAVEYVEDPQGEHAFRVASYAARIAVALGWNAADVERLRLAAQLHDIGKLGIAAEIRTRPEKLDAAELELIRAHPKIAASLLEGVRSPLLQLASDIAVAHHERWDGTGYPHGLTGDAIPIAARIVAVADVYDILTRGRPYQAPCAFNDASLEIERESGKQFDPTVVKAALEVLR